MFIKYPHVERFGTDEVQSIELGECFIFPKIDGTNASVWIDDGEAICSGSRNRELSLDNDNAGFHAAIQEHIEIAGFLRNNPQLRLYGEWLVPHSLKTYRDDAWRTFYVFDVYHNEDERFLPYNEYAPMLDGEYDIELIHPLAIIKNASYEQLLAQAEKNVFLIEEGKGSGEGIVIKNYEYENRYGRTTWPK